MIDVILSIPSFIIAFLIPHFIVAFLAARNPNGRGIWRCTCCGCFDGCDAHCDELERACRVHGVRLARAIACDRITSARQPKS